MNIIISRSAYTSNSQIQKQFAANLIPIGDFSQPLTTEFESPIPLRMLGSANLDVVKSFYPKYVEHNGTKVFAVDAQSAHGVAFDAQNRPVIVKWDSNSDNSGAVFLLGYDLGDIATVHWRVTHSGKTHPIYDRDTACGLERPTIAALNAALFRPSLNTNPKNRLHVQLIPASMLVDKDHPIPTLQIKVTDQNGQPPARIQINARTRLRVDNSSKPSSPYFRLKQSTPGIFDVTFAPRKEIEAAPDKEVTQLPYFPFDKPFSISKILSVQMKVFAVDKNGVSFVPEDTACCFILND